LDELVSPEDSFYAFYNPNDLSTLNQAMAQLDSYISMEGPFDGILGFSAGSVLAGLYLAEKQRKTGQVPVKCAVFLSSATSIAEMTHLEIDTHHAYIPIPTVHIWGDSDETAPTGGRDLSQICHPERRSTLIHEGGHELPRKEHLTKAAHAIRRTIYLASDLTKC
jgi:hypothetical protein